MRISDWSSDVCSSDLLVFYGNHDADYGPVALEKDGAYTLIFEGRVDDANPSATYEFQVSRIADKPAALTPGATTGGTPDQPYQSALLTFTLADDTFHNFDALTAASSLVWTLPGPRGDVPSSSTECRDGEGGVE